MKDEIADSGMHDVESRKKLQCYKAQLAMMGSKMEEGERERGMFKGVER